MILNKILTKLFERELKIIKQSYATRDRNQIPEIFIDLLILAEDKRFYSHGGVDISSVIRATWVYLSKGQIQGASTIEQQLVRTVTGSYERTLKRKIKEIILAKLIYEIVPKVDVPKFYLSLAYFGFQKRGVLEACEKMKVDTNNLNTSSAAKVIARLKYPAKEDCEGFRKIQIEKRANIICDFYEKSNKRNPASST